MSLIDLTPISPNLIAILAKGGGLTRVDLQHRLGVSGPTVTRATAELNRLGIIEARHAATTGLGRPAESIFLSTRGLCSIGVSIRADKSSVRLLDCSGQAVAGRSLEISQETPYLSAVKSIGDGVIEMILLARDRFDVLSGVGISFFGSANYRHGKITDPSTFKAWHHKPLAHDLAAYTGLSTAIENYSIALVSAINWFDAAEPADFFLVVADYGIGGVPSIENKPFLGPNRRPAGFGHIEGRAEGKILCYCGAYDCQMTSASVRAMRARAEEWGVISPGRADLGDLIEELDQMDDQRVTELLSAAGERLAKNALGICQSVGLPICVFGGILFDHSSIARGAVARAFSVAGHAVRARFLVDVFAGRETDDLAAAAVAYHHLSRTRKVCLLKSQQGSHPVSVSSIRKGER